MNKLVVDVQRCKSCGLCLTVCPQKNLQVSKGVNQAGYHPVCQGDEESCTGCGLCALMCPDVCFSIYRVKQEDGQDE